METFPYIRNALLANPFTLIQPGSSLIQTTYTAVYSLFSKYTNCTEEFCLLEYDSVLSVES